MSTLLPSNLVPPQDEHIRELIDTSVIQAHVHAVNGELIVNIPGARITFARRDKDRCGPRSLSAYTRFVLEGLPGDRTRAYEQSIIAALFEIATRSARATAPLAIQKKYLVDAFVTRLTYQVHGGNTANDYRHSYRSNGYVRVNSHVVDVLMKIL